MLTAIKLGLAATVAALSIAAVTSAGAVVDPGSIAELVDQEVARAQGIRQPNPPSAGSPPTTMTTAISAIGATARARWRALHPHPRAPLSSCRPKRATSVRRIWVTAAQVSSGAAA